MTRLLEIIKVEEYEDYFYEIKDQYNRLFGEFRKDYFNIWVFLPNWVGAIYLEDLHFIILELKGLNGESK